MPNVVVTSAVDLTSSEKNTVSKLTHTDVSLINFMVDAAVIGGISIEADGKKIDLTLSNQLASL